MLENNFCPLYPPLFLCKGVKNPVILELRWFSTPQMGGTIQFVEVDPSNLRWPHHEREFHCAPACVCVHACEHHMVCDVVLGRLWLLTGGLQSNYLGYGGMGQQTAGCTLHQTCADLSCSHLPGSITNARGRMCACAKKKQKTCY